MSSGLPRNPREPWGLRLNRLIPHRVREILLVSSRYDAFVLEEDGSLTERLFWAYSELGLSWFPRITHAATGQEAIRLLGERHFDLVLTTSRLGNTDVHTLARRIKELDEKMPVVLLTFNEADVVCLPGGLDRALVDHVFLWSGDARILIAISKIVEDRRNVAHDTEVGGVPVILVVEDSVRYYSTFLTLLYAEIIDQAQSLIAEGVNNLHKALRLRARPKVLLASSYEEAMDHYRAYPSHIMAVMSDVRFERGGVEDAKAGLALCEEIRRDSPDVPFLLQSVDRTNAAPAQALNAHYVDKNYVQLAREIREFVSAALGFGDFVFCLPDGDEVARARSADEMEKRMHTVPLASIGYHAARNNFCVWLKARGLFDLAELVRPRRVDDFSSLEELRWFLIEGLRKALLREQEGLVTDFASGQTTRESRFVRVGRGSIGGKARGVAYCISALARHDWGNDRGGLDVRVPKTIVLGTEVFESFLRDNGLTQDVQCLTDDGELRHQFLRGDLPADVLRDLEEVWNHIEGPLAVRSSSMLEDLQFQPFAGIYATYMLANNHPDLATRFFQLQQAIKAVYASAFCANARAYISSTPFMPEEEKMAVIVQEVVGQAFGTRFYPHMSGVALSHNYYPVGAQTAAGGTAQVALGLGHLVVSGGQSLRFSPGAPDILPQFGTSRDVLRDSQRTFYALDLTQQESDFFAEGDATLRLFGLEAAEEDGSLDAVGSVYCAEDDVIRDGLNRPGPRVITFNNVLKWRSMPLATTLHRLLDVVSSGMGCAAEIEFAVDMGDRVSPRSPALYVLQIRPLATQFLTQHLGEKHFRPEQVFCQTNRSLGHGFVHNVYDIVYVRPGVFCSETAHAIAAEVERVNGALCGARSPYILIGPGRWGTRDPRLGIPVHWRQISGARIIAEIDVADCTVEPSQGSHFFQNMTSLGIGYLTLMRDPEHGGETSAAPGFIDLGWLQRQPAVFEGSWVRHVHMTTPTLAYLDGQRGSATILKPARAP